MKGVNNVLRKGDGGLRGITFEDGKLKIILRAGDHELRARPSQTERRSCYGCSGQQSSHLASKDLTKESLEVQSTSYFFVLLPLEGCLSTRLRALGASLGKRVCRPGHTDFLARWARQAQLKL